MNITEVANELKKKAQEYFQMAERYNAAAETMKALVMDPASLPPLEGKRAYFERLAHTPLSEFKPPKKRSLSASARRLISKAQKDRWRRWHEVNDKKKGKLIPYKKRA